MGISRKLLSLLSLSTAAAWAARDPSLVDTLKDAEIPFVKNRYIVEVESISKSGFARRGETLHKRLYEDLKSRAVGFEINKEFDTPNLFVGVSLTLESQEDVTKLKSIEGVKSIRPVHILQRPKPTSARGLKGPEDLQPQDKQSTHILTGVDLLHEEGRSGKGINIGIIDTGIDYTHPALGNGFGPGFKVVGGYDFVGDDYTGSNAPIPDNDPLDLCDGHGTHVAGIIGADPLNNPFNISGVAYSASISSYRIFGCYGSVTDDIIIEALLRAAQDNQDILTLSLGGTDGWTESTSSVVASRIAESGKVVTIAAGNEGANGAWFTASPGNGLGVISVGSSDNIATTVNSATVGGAQHDPILYKNYRVIPLPVTGALPIYATSKSTTTERDACDPLPASTPDLSGHVVIIQTGGCYLSDKTDNVIAKGASAVLFYLPDGVFDETWVYGEYPQAGIRRADGEWLVKQFAAGANITLTFPQTGGSVDLPDPEGGLISSFSTYGPTNDMYFKPALSAPGGNILSTYTTGYGYPYQILSGTSMATPFIAGSAALLLEAKGKSAEVAKGIQAMLQTTALGIQSTHDSKSLLQTLTQQGAGLVNVYNAIHTTTSVLPGELLLNDTAHFKGVHDITVKNTGSTEQTYKVTHVPAGTAETVQPGKIEVAFGPVPLTNNFASLSFSESSFTLGAGQTKVIKATFTAPAEVDKAKFPVYSGFVQVASARDSLHVSYMGLAASLKDKVVLDTTTDVISPAPPYLNFGPFSEVQTGPKNYSFTDFDYPRLRLRLTFGTPILRLDWVDSAVTLSKRAELPANSSFTFPQKIAAAPVQIFAPYMEVDYLTRNTEYIDLSSIPANTFIIAPVFANGTIMPNGSYKMLVRALRVTGDPSNAADYDTWLSPIIGVQYQG